MKQEELQEIKDEYNRINHFRKIAYLLNEEKAALEEEQMVKRYIEVCSRLDQLKGYLGYEDSDSIGMAIEKTNITETNGIYVYLGTYAYPQTFYQTSPFGYINTNHDDERAAYSEYVDIEKDLVDTFKVDIKHRAEFEANNDVIYLNKNYVNHASFYRLKHEFFTSIIENGQEKTVDTIKKQLVK